MTELPEHCAVLVYGWQADGMPQGTFEAIAEGLAPLEGWTAVVQGILCFDRADQPVFGTVVAAVEPDDMSGEMLDSGEWEWDDLTLFADVPVTAADIARAKAQYTSGRGAAKKLLEDHDIRIGRPAMWFVMRGYARYAVLVDAEGTSHFTDEERDPRKLTLPDGDHRAFVI